MISDPVANEETRRREFPICARKIYCAHAADAPLPRRVAEAMRESIERASTNERQFEIELGRIATTRAAVAQLLGATPAEISFTGPTSSGLGVIANGLEWRPDDEVVCYLEEYPANVYPWLALERRGVKIVLLDPARLGEITPERTSADQPNETGGAGNSEFLQRLSNRCRSHRRALRGARSLLLCRCHSNARRLSSRARSR